MSDVVDEVTSLATLTLLVQLIDRLIERGILTESDRRVIDQRAGTAMFAALEEAKKNA